MNFNLTNFYKFCDNLSVETKEDGLKKLTNRLGTQTYVMDEIAKGLEEDTHFFVILKGDLCRMAPTHSRSRSMLRNSMERSYRATTGLSSGADVTRCRSRMECSISCSGVVTRRCRMR